MKITSGFFVVFRMSKIVYLLQYWIDSMFRETSNSGEAYTFWIAAILILLCAKRERSEIEGIDILSFAGIIT